MGCMRLNLIFMDLFNVMIEQASEMISQVRVSIRGLLKYWSRRLLSKSPYVFFTY